jgi:hypothetical protein
MGPVVSMTHLSPVTGVLGNLNSTVDTVGQEETTDIEIFGMVKQDLDFWLLKVVLREGLSGSKSGDEGPASREEEI